MRERDRERDRETERERDRERETERERERERETWLYYFPVDERCKSSNLYSLCGLYRLRPESYVLRVEGGLKRSLIYSPGAR